MEKYKVKKDQRIEKIYIKESKDKGRKIYHQDSYI